MAKNLKNLPEAVILLAENDVFREEGLNYANRLETWGVSTFVYCQLGIGHLAGHGARASAQARESLDVVVATLKKAFSKDSAVKKGSQEKGSFNSQGYL